MNAAQVDFSLTAHNLNIFFLTYGIILFASPYHFETVLLKSRCCIQKLKIRTVPICFARKQYFLVKLTMLPGQRILGSARNRQTMI